MTTQPDPMRLKLTLQPTGRHRTIPINYGYELSAWIYGVIAQADAGYAAFLHNQGFAAQGSRKNFKLFTFSQLGIARRNIRGDRLEIVSNEVSLVVSFYLDKAAEHFIMGLFAAQQFGLGDRVSRVDFVVAQVESLPVVLPAGPVRFKTLSPLVVGRKNSRGHDDYLAPTDADFERLLLLNLADKHQATGNAPPPTGAEKEMRLTVLTLTPKEKLILLKSGTPQQTRVKGYLFDFELAAPAELLETGYLAGFGRYNAEGFGCCEVI